MTHLHLRDPSIKLVSTASIKKACLRLQLPEEVKMFDVVLGQVQQNTKPGETRVVRVAREGRQVFVCQ